MPHHLQRMRKINLGIIGKQGKDGKPRTRTELTKSAKKHAANNLHLWCMQKAQQEKQELKTYKEKNREVANNVVRAALKNLKRGLGAADFMADMDYIHSTPGIPSSQKNDSKGVFFQIRDDAFEIISGDIHRFVKEHVTELSVTLDKVTVCHISYIVLLTFFYNGHIYCYLNKLATIPAENYNAEGTASLVVSTLTETLGLSWSHLANLLVHF